MQTTDLNQIFETLKELLQPYSPPLTPKKDLPGYYDLWSLKDVSIDGRKRKEVYFGGVILYKTYVGFYYMPVYADADMKATFSPALLALLKGKSCFHIRRLDDALLADIRAALQAGYGAYQERGWV